ncbi:MAG TPA: hypothetical protein VFY07_00505 [Geomobilimonas sp.]|nr:hypothetical protein [Geomobilimonas sp.]
MGKRQAVQLVLWESNLPEELMQYRMQIGYIDGAVGDDVLARFGDTVIQVDPEFLKPVESKEH